MSEMDKFVLQYTVEMKDAITRLEQLNGKVDGVKKATVAAGKEFAEFSNGAADEIGKLIPGVDKVTAGVRAMTGQFALAATAVAVLGVGVKSVIDLRTQFGEQRMAGMATGVSGTRMEEYARKFVNNSNGNVSRPQAQEQIRSLSEKLQAAYADPTRMGTEARTFRLLGVDIGDRGKDKTPFNDALSQLAEKFSKMKPEQVQGIAKAIGMSEDFALTLQRLGPSVGKVTELTEAEINKRAAAEDSLKKFNTEVSRFNEKMNELEMTLGQKLIPGFTELIDIINQFVNILPKAATKVQQKGEEYGVDLGGAIDTVKGSSIFDFAKNANPLVAFPNFMKKITSWANEEGPNPDEKSVSTGQVIRGTQPTSGKKDLVASLDAMVDTLDQTNRDATNNAANMQQAINMFAGAVSTFSNAVDEKQAWAAWAGEVGRAGGLALPGGSGGLSPSVNVPGRPGVSPVGPYNPETQYDDIYERESKRSGIPVELLKRVSRVESQFNPNAESEAGAQGLMQVMPANKKGTGTNDLFDPAQNIKAGAQILSEFLKQAGGDVRTALTMYHGGTNRANWGPRTLSYADKVLGETEVSKGESRNKLQLRSVQQNVAGRLGVPLNQLQQGGASHGDVSWSLSQMKAGVENNIFDINKQLMQVGLPQQTRSKLLTDLREQQSGLNMLNKYGKEVEGNSAPGGRSITIGERAIVINVAAAKDPEVTSRIIEGHLQNNLGDIVNGAADGMKY